MNIPNLDINKEEDDNSYILNWPFRMVIVGDSSRGKTNLVMYMIVSTNIFNKPDIVYYYGRNINQDTIQKLKSISDKMKEKIGYDFIVLENDPSNIPYADSDDNDSTKLVIFDDLLCVSNNISKKNNQPLYFWKAEKHIIDISSAILY